MIDPSVRWDELLTVGNASRIALSLTLFGVAIYFIVSWKRQVWELRIASAFIIGSSLGWGWAMIELMHPVLFSPGAIVSVLNSFAILQVVSSMIYMIARDRMKIAQVSVALNSEKIASNLRVDVSHLIDQNRLHLDIKQNPLFGADAEVDDKPDEAS